MFKKLNTWEKDRRFVVSRVLKPEKERAQLSLLEGAEYEYFFFVTNSALLSEIVVISYEKRGNAENYIKEAKYDMAVGYLSFEVCISGCQNNQDRQIRHYGVIGKLSA